LERLSTILDKKYRVALHLLAMLLFIISPPVSANEGRELAQKVLGYHSATARLNELARSASRISYIESIALLSVQGDWKHEKGNWPKDGNSPFFYDVSQLNGRFIESVAHMEKYLKRDKTLDETERTNFATIIENFREMLKDSSTLYDLLQEGDIEQANAFYRDRIRERYLEILNASYTLGQTLEDRIKKTNLKVRMLK
jgi:hypothetical protein